MDERLTRREIQCVYLAGFRLSDQEIADRLGVSRKSVGNYLQSAFGKLGVRDRRRAAARLGERYPGIEIPDAEQIGAAPVSGRPVESPGPIAVDDRPWLARVWRAPPRGVLTRLGLILGVAVLYLLVLRGGMPLMEDLIAATDHFRPS